MFQPKVLSPTPDPDFVRQLKKIDPDLRVVWAYERYLRSTWAIERKMSAERYFTAHAWLFNSNLPRFAEQPIYDTDSPLIDSEGNQLGYKQVGTRRYDMAPEYEWLMFTETTGEDTITQLKRAYAWERNHPISRMYFERQQEEEKKQEAFDKKLNDVTDAAVDEAFLETRKKVQFGYGETRNEQ